MYCNPGTFRQIEPLFYIVMIDKRGPSLCEFTLLVTIMKKNDLMTFNVMSSADTNTDIV